MNLRKGIFRIFLVISSLWFIIFASFATSETTSFWFFISIAVGVPVVLYFLGKWISDGFFDKK